MAEESQGLRERVDKPTVFMMDLLATVPYYTAYLSRALLGEGVRLQVGSITYYLDRACFSSRNIPLDPGCMDVMGKLSLPRSPRRVLKLAETCVNLIALTMRFCISPPEVVHVQYLPMLRWRLPLDAWFVAFCRRRGVKIVLTVHDVLPHDTQETYRAVFEKLYTRVDGIICHSQHIRQRLQEEFGVGAEKISVIPHGPFFFDLPGAPAAPPEADEQACLRVLWQGIIFPYKGLDVLLDAWAGVEREVPGARLVVAGTGAVETLEAVRAQVATLGLERVTLVLRFTTAEELVSLYRTADIVVYPYRAITTSGALATGLALGKAIVASDLPVFRELLTDGKDATLVESSNSYKLSQALVKLLRDTGLREQYAAAVRAKQFGYQSWNFIAESTLNVYKSVLIHA